MNTTIQLEADFEGDLRSHAHAWLANTWGAEAHSIDAEDVLMRFFDAQIRLPRQSPRTVLTADTFSCTPTDQAGLDSLLDKVRRGDDIRPHMSTNHESYSYQDGLLNDWNVHHFHVGIGPHPEKQNFNARSTNLLFALIRD